MNKEVSKQTFLLSFLIIFASQLYINANGLDFKISMGIILYPLYAMIFGEFPVVYVTLITAPGVYLSRILRAYLASEIILGQSYWQEIIFYLVYGLSFCMYMKRIKFNFSSKASLVPLAILDYLANSLELFLRHDKLFAFKMQTTIIMVALVRLFLVWSIWSLLEYQSIRLLKKEHSERYKKLILMISSLKGEIVWMEKNAINVENTTATGYQLYEKLLSKGSPLSDDALSVAKDIHEIKKGYRLITDGIAEATGDCFKDEPMNFREIFAILCENTNQYAETKGKKIVWEVEIDRDFYTDKQYQLLSILRNLFDNAVEAAWDDKFRMSFTLLHCDDSIGITVTNTKSYIPKENFPKLFTAGFTTKIDYATGQIKRGIGLCLVKDLVEKELRGSLSVVSENNTTTFLIMIPKSVIESNERG